MSEFIWPVRVYHEDTDGSGIVYYANYLKFMERARTEWLRAQGFEQDRLSAENGIIFVVSNIAVNFLKPGRFNQLLEVSATIIRRGRASLTFDQKITASDAAVLCTAQVKLACVNLLTWRPCPLAAHFSGEQ